MSLRYIDILPSNISSTSEAGYSKGTPLIQFSIGAQENFLIGSTIRLNGSFSRRGTNTNKSMFEPSLGVYNILDQLVISSNKTNQTKPLNIFETIIVSLLHTYQLHPRKTI